MSDTTEEEARARNVPGTHTIWELVLHTSAWLRIARERLSAKEPVYPEAAENWPAVSGSWQTALTSLRNETRALEEAIAAFPESRLVEKAPAAEDQTFYQLLHGVVQHSAYHAGQISLLKRAAALSR